MNTFNFSLLEAFPCYYQILSTVEYEYYHWLSVAQAPGVVITPDALIKLFLGRCPWSQALTLSQLQLMLFKSVRFRVGRELGLCVPGRFWSYYVQPTIK